MKYINTMRAKLVSLRLPWPVCPTDQLCIEPEPENKYDPNALKVLVSDSGAWRMAGYVDSDAAALLKGKSLTSVRALTAGDGTFVPIEILLKDG